MSGRALAVLLLLAGTARAALIPGKLVSDGPSDRPYVALTYDDGPGSATSELLAVLKKSSAPATFFVLSRSMKEHPGLASKVAADGHLVACHGDKHPNFVKVDEKKREDLLWWEMEFCQSALKGENLPKATMFRMPHGYDRPWVRPIALKHGLSLVNWTYGSDWTKLSEAEMLEGYKKKLRPGAILLLHDGGRGGKRAARLTEALLAEMKKKNLQPVRLDVLLSQDTSSK